MDNFPPNIKRSTQKERGFNRRATYFDTSKSKKQKEFAPFGTLTTCFD